MSKSTSNRSISSTTKSSISTATTWTAEGYWATVLGQTTPAQAVREYGLVPSDRSGVDEWLGAAEVEAWRVGGEGGEIPESWSGFHANALDQLCAVVGAVSRGYADHCIVEGRVDGQWSAEHAGAPASAQEPRPRATLEADLPRLAKILECDVADLRVVSR